jgi:hypothetical protein
MFIIFFLFLLFTYLRLVTHVANDRSINNSMKSLNNNNQQSYSNNDKNFHLVDKCDFNDTVFLLNYRTSRNTTLTGNASDARARPTIERLHTLFSILISYEEKFRKVFDYLEIFRFNDLYHTLKPFANHTQRLHDTFCLFQRYITISDNGHINIAPNFIVYLEQLSTYLADGFISQHLTWNRTDRLQNVDKPVIILGANTRFFDTLQASMRTVNQYFNDSRIAIYDLGFEPTQLTMVSNTCCN